MMKQSASPNKKNKAQVIQDMQKKELNFTNKSSSVCIQVERKRRQASQTETGPNHVKFLNRFGSPRHSTGPEMLSQYSEFLTPFEKNEIVKYQ